MVIGGFNEHSAEVHCFVERAAAAGAAAVVAEEGLAYEDVRAALRKRYRQRLATGAWRDFHTHLLARLPYINPTPAAEAKLLAQPAVGRSEDVPAMGGDSESGDDEETGREQRHRARGERRQAPRRSGGSTRRGRRRGEGTGKNGPRDRQQRARHPGNGRRER